MLVDFIRLFRDKFVVLVNKQDTWSKGEVMHVFLLSLDWALAQLNHKHKEKK